MENKTIEELVRNQIKIHCDENGIEFVELNNNTRLIGSDALFDSMGLVIFLVELEEKIEEQFSIEIEIADEKAMSRFKSPFMNIESLVEFLIEKMNEV